MQLFRILFCPFKGTFGSDMVTYSLQNTVSVYHLLYCIMMHSTIIARKSKKTWKFETWLDQMEKTTVTLNHSEAQNAFLYLFRYGLSGTIERSFWAALFQKDSVHWVTSCRTQEPRPVEGRLLLTAVSSPRLAVTGSIQLTLAGFSNLPRST